MEALRCEEMSTAEATVQRILAGDLRALARAITAVENGDPQADDLLRQLFPHSGRALVVGITGSPGAGKSTLVDRMAAGYRRQEKTVGIIAVDPSSPFSGGAILGDRIRMQGHSSDPGIYIRSMATRGNLGGLARATADVATLLDAAGRDCVLVETVGVGQDEVDVVKLTDVTVLLLVPGMGDGVQTIKAGLMEIADIFAINKADRADSDRLEQELHALLSISQRTDGWAPPVLKTVATEGAGVEELLTTIERYRGFLDSAGLAEQKVRQNWRQRLLALLRERLLNRVVVETLDNGLLDEYAARVAARQVDPYSVVDEVMRKAGL